MRLFSPEEANRALPVVRPLVERLVRLRSAFRELESELADVRGKVAGNGGGGSAYRAAGLESAAEKAVAAMKGIVEELERLGVQVKDVDTGLVDFPARHPSGATVLLCWRLGEDEVRFWHELEAGFAGRKPLPF